MKNKGFRFLGSLTLIGILCFGVPSPLFASSANDSDVELSARHKTVEMRKLYGKSEQIPETIYYNQGGWSGTLEKVGKRNNGDFYEITYRGTVSCPGPCTM